MQFEKKFRVEGCTSKDESRHILNHLHLTKDGMLEATNGAMAIRVPVVMDETDKPGCISRESVIWARKCSPKDILIECADKLITTDKTEFVRPPEQMMFPNVEGIFPRERDHRFAIAINPTRLLDLAKGIGSPDGIILKIKDGESIILVKPSDGANASVAVIMPLKHAEGNDAWKEGA